MKYRFTQADDTEYLDISGDAETSLHGFQQFNDTANPSMIVSDVFHIVGKVVSEEAESGGRHEIYEIDRHYKMVDRIPQIGEMNAVNWQGVMESEDALCDLDAQYAERISTIEDVLCELDEGGEA